MPTAYLKTESVGSDTHRQNARKYRPRTKLIGPWLYLCHCGSQIYCSGTIADLSRRGRQLPLLAERCHSSASAWPSCFGRFPILHAAWHSSLHANQSSPVVQPTSPEPDQPSPHTASHRARRLAHFDSRRSHLIDTEGTRLDTSQHSPGIWHT